MSIFGLLDPRKVPQNIDTEDELFVLRERSLQLIFIISSGIGLIVYIQTLLNLISTRNWGLMAVYSLGYLAILIITFLRNIQFRRRVTFALILLYALGVISLVGNGLGGSWRVFMMGFSTFAAIMLGTTMGAVSAFISIISVIIVGTLMVSGILPPPTTSLPVVSTSIGYWISDGTAFTVLILIVVIAINTLTQGIEIAVKNQKQLSQELRLERDRLEERVVQRTMEIERHVVQVEAASQLARDISINIDLEILLKNAVELIRNRFGFYHAGIFLVDERNEYAVLRAATGEAGKIMLENNHRLKVGEVGMVGYVVSKGEPRVSLNVDEDVFHYKNPFLPDTQSELAMPLRGGEKIIGALDVQSEKPNAFSPDDVKILQTLADQLAVAIDKSKLVQKLQESLEAIEQSSQKFTEQSWREHLKNSRKKFNYRYNQDKLEEVKDNDLATGEVSRPDRVTITPVLEEKKPYSQVTLPLKLRGVVLGVLTIKFASETLSPNMIGMLEMISDRLSSALENARLLEELQFRAEREHLVSDIANRVRSETEIGNILRVAAEQIGRAMGVSEVVVQLRSDKKLP